jgi:DNA-binding Lrp family transcriptional regulator
VSPDIETASPLSERDGNRLMRAIQADVPFVERPFAAIADPLGLSERSVLDQLRDWTERKLLREISAVLEGAALGYDSALATGVVPDARLDRAVEVVNAHPTVTHNYLRDHGYNLWFTVAVPREMSLEDTLGFLAREAGLEDFHALRRTGTFKIGVNFDPETLTNRTPPVRPKAIEPIEVSLRDARLFRVLQTPLPLVARPFRELAQRARVEPEVLLAFAHRHRGSAIRRYVGTLRHRKLGVRENGMAVWRVPEAEQAEVGRRLASAPEVSHCYARNAIEGFPYTLYSMIHGPDRDHCREVAARLARETSAGDYAVLFSAKEFKKVRLRYFLPELDAWWAARAGGATASPGDFAPTSKPDHRPSTSARTAGSRT